MYKQGCVDWGVGRGHTLNTCKKIGGGLPPILEKNDTSWSKINN